MLKRLEDITNRHPFLAHGLELFILLALALAVGLVSVQLYPGVSPGVVGVFPGVVVGLLVLSRVVRSRMWFLVAANALVLCVFAIPYLIWLWPMISEIRNAVGDTPLLPSPWIPVPSYFAAGPVLVQMIGLFLFGIYCARRSFRLWKFCAGFLVGGVALRLLFRGAYPFFLAGVPYALVLQMILAIAVLCLPLQRQALERLFGFPLRSSEAGDAAAPATRGSFLFGLLAHGTLLWIFVLMVFGTVLMYYEWEIIRVFALGGPEPAHHSPAERNGYDDLRTLNSLAGNKEYARLTTCTLPVDLPFFGEALPPKVADQAIAAMNRAQVEAVLAKAQPWFDVLARTADADYCVLLEPDRMARPQFGIYITLARALAVQAVMRTAQDRPEDALRAVETVLRIARLFDDDWRSVVTPIRANQLREIGLGVARTYYLRFAEEPDRLVLLGNLLGKMQPDVCVDFDYGRIRQVEPSYWNVVPYYDVISTGRAVTRAVITLRDQYYAQWIKYNFLVLTVALERYRAEHSQYPETLQALIPKYLAQMSLDPICGEPYVYQRTESGFSLDRPSRFRDAEIAKYLRGWGVPASQADETELRDFLERRIAEYKESKP